ncbi:MAG: response regulator [candidate division KSB1 bacterium]|nr:response regulator [candidate division KSB1 bacterium]
MNQSGHILVIDDEEVIRSGCQQILEADGYHVDLADNGKSGLELIRKNDYDLVLTDIMMPEMDGMQVLDELQKMDSRTVSIVITGYASIESAIDAGRKGAFDYIAKPFDPDELSTRVERGLKQAEHLQQVERLRKERDENLLEISNERARTLTIINSMHEGVIATNRQKQVVLMNPAAIKMLRLKRQKIIGQTVQDILTMPDLTKTINEILETVKSSLKTLQKEFDTPDGRVLQASITPIQDENQACIGTVTVLFDITREKQVEQMKSDFVSHVSHELKAPLNAIQGYLDLILEGIAGNDPEKERDIVQKSRNRAKALSDLINDLLDLSRVEQRNISKEMEPVQLQEVLTQVIDFYRSKADEKSITLKTSLPEDTPPVRGNKQDLDRLFANLVSNAVKYTPENGNVDIRLDSDPEHVNVRIKDSGIGFTPETKNKIFDEFYRAENAVEQKISGTGLGLSIAKKIAEDHQGYIEVESQVNKGSTFYVIFPAYK